MAVISQHKQPLLLDSCGLAIAYTAWNHALGQLTSENLCRLSDAIGGSSQAQIIMRSLRQHLRNPQPIRAAAQSIGWSTDHLTRMCQQYISMTPSQYVREQRIHQACELLEHTDYSIENVAERCGFRDRFYFSRVFTKVTGTSPARYRKQTIH